jgi:integrase
MPITVSEAVAQWSDVLAGRDLAESYRTRQLGRLRGFAAVCEEVLGQAPEVGQVDYDCITRYFASLTGSTGDRNNKLDALRQFLRWADRRGWLQIPADDLLDGYKARKVTRAPKLYLEADEFAELLDLAGEHHPRTRAMAAAILYTLARQSEIAALQLKDLDLCTRTIRLHRQKLRRHTETGITQDLAGEMTAWLAWYARHTGYISADAMAADHPDWYLIPAVGRAAARKRLNPVESTTDMERLIKPLLVKMGYPDFHEGCHTLRRSGAREMFKHLRDKLGFDGALLWVQKMLDHDKAKTTLDYIDVERERAELNDYLRSNSMYGTGATVTPLRGLA